VLFAAGAFGVVRSGSGGDGPPPVVAPVGAPSLPGAGAPGAGTLEELVDDLQVRLRAVPGDHVSWATLGLAYVQQARVTVDPSFYPRAEGALQRSLGITEADNFLAYAGLSALAAARHDFLAAKQHAERGLQINPYSAILHGALSDAQIQLGQYEAGFASVQRMVDLSPDTASLTRASYAWELRGDVVQAEALMRRALEDAPRASDRAFALHQLGQLAFNDGRLAEALELQRAALDAVPDDVAALAGKARAEAALGQVQTALDDFAAVVARAPEPGYVVEYAELLLAAGRTEEAERQFEVFRATQRLFETNGVQGDAVVAMFHADHGDPADALAAAEAGLVTNPFVAMHDAHAWALHRSGRDAEALVSIDAALGLGVRDARFHFHAGMISRSLGDDDRARRELTTALSINPEFHPLDAVTAREVLDELGGPV